MQFFCVLTQNLKPFLAPSFVIGLVAVDLKRAVDLLQQNHAHHLMREGHLRKRELKIRPFGDLITEAEAAADDEGKIALTL